MSMYSGKCDCYDWFDGKDDDYISQCDFYIRVDDKEFKLDIHSRNDLVPYYPHLITTGYHDKDRSVVFLSTKSYVDMEEEEHMQYRLEEIIRKWKKCKNKFNEEEILNNSYYFGDKEIYKEVIRRVAENGDKATMDGIHDSFCEFERDKLYQKMIDVGYDKDKAFRWVYGFKRWLNDKKRASEEKADSSKEQEAD